MNVHEKAPAAYYAAGATFFASKTVSRVLYLTAIYLGAPLPVRSSHPGSGRAGLSGANPRRSHTGVAPDRVYSIGHSRADGCALTAPFHPYHCGKAVMVRVESDFFEIASAAEGFIE